MARRPVKLPPVPEVGDRPVILARIYPGYHEEAVEPLPGGRREPRDARLLPDRTVLRGWAVRRPLGAVRSLARAHRDRGPDPDLHGRGPPQGLARGDVRAARGRLERIRPGPPSVDRPRRPAWCMPASGLSDPGFTSACVYACCQASNNGPLERDLALAIDTASPRSRRALLAAALGAGAATVASAIGRPLPARAANGGLHHPRSVERRDGDHRHQELHDERVGVLGHRARGRRRHRRRRSRGLTRSVRARGVWGNAHYGTGVSGTSQVGHGVEGLSFIRRRGAWRIGRELRRPRRHLRRGRGEGRDSNRHRQPVHHAQARRAAHGLRPAHGRPRQARPLRRAGDDPKGVPLGRRHV